MDAEPSTLDELPIEPIAIIADDMMGFYASRAIAGAIDEIVAAGRSWTCLVGGSENQPHNALYELARHADVSGSVLVTPGIIVSADRLSSLCPAAAVPLSGIVMAPPDATCVAADNAQGIRLMVDHLALEHGHRTFAFIGGPRSHPDAVERLRAVREAVRAHERTNLSEHSAGESFGPDHADRVIARLIEQGLPHAIVCVSDSMAVGVLRLLASRGVRVPDDVAVVGFDDFRIAADADPPLTTVRQPLYRIGSVAARAVLSPVLPPAKQRVPVELIVRRSCGCRRMILRESPLSDANEDPRLPLLRILERAYAQVSPDAQERAAALLAALEALVSNSDSADLEGELQGLARRLDRAEVPQEVLEHTCQALQHAFGVLFGSSHHRAKLDAACALAHDAFARANAHRRVLSERVTMALSGLGARLAEIGNFRELSAALADSLGDLEVSAAYVSLVGSPVGPATRARLVAGFDRQGMVDLDLGEADYLATDLLPARAPSSNARGFVIHPLVHDEQCIGMAALAMDGGNRLYIAALLRQVAACVRRLTRELGVPLGGADAVATAAAKDVVVAEARLALDANLDQEVDLRELCRRHGIGFSTFRMRFTQIVGVPPSRYRAERAIERACELMREGKLSDKQIAYQVGFADELYFSRRFKALRGMSPTEYRESVGQAPAGRKSIPAPKT